MTISCIRVNGINIAYLEKNTTAENILFFIHGNSLSKESWSKQYHSDLFSAYHIIAIDLPGHGDSEAAPNPEESYHVAALADTLQQVIQQLSNRKPYILAGLSLATNIIAEMPPQAFPPTGLVLASPCVTGTGFPLEQVFKTGNHVSVVFTNAAEEEVEAYATEAMRHPSKEDLELFLNAYYSTDKKFRSTLAASVAAGKFGDEIANLEAQKIPVLAVFGSEEEIVVPGYLALAPINLFEKKVHLVEEAGHLVNTDQPEAFNYLLLNFARTVFHR